MKKCAHLQCGRTHSAKGLCIRHYTYMFEGRGIARPIGYRPRKPPVDERLDELSDLLAIGGDVREWADRNKFSLGALERAAFRRNRTDLAMVARRARLLDSQA